MWWGFHRSFEQENRTDFFFSVRFSVGWYYCSVTSTNSSHDAFWQFLSSGRVAHQASHILGYENNPKSFVTMPCEIDEDLSSYASKYTFFSGLQSFNFSIAASIQTWGISILCFILKFECLNEFIEFFKVLSGYRSESKYNFSLLLLRLLATNLLFLLSGFFFHNHSRVTDCRGRGTAYL